MSLLIAVKVLGDLCFYFFVLGMFPHLFPHTVEFIWPALLCGGGTLAAVFLQWQVKPGLRYAALLLPLAALGMVSSFTEALIFLPALLYTGIVVHRGLFALDYHSYRESFLHSLIVWAAVFGIGILMRNIVRSVDAADRFDYMCMLRYGSVYGFFGIFLLRQLRLEDGARQESFLTNLSELLTALGLSGAAVLLTALPAQAGLRLLYENFRGAARRLILGIWDVAAGVLMWVISLFANSDPDRKARYEEMLDRYSQPKPELQAIPPGSPQISHAVTEAKEEFPWWLAALIILLLLVILWRMLRPFLKGGKGTLSASSYVIAAPEGRPERRLLYSNREKVRRCYRDFLRLVTKKGMPLDSTQTSEEILATALKLVDPEAAEALRAVYVSARYDEKRDVTEEQVRLAKAAVRKLGRGK